MSVYNGYFKKHNGTDWDILYLKTTAENIVSGILHVDRIPNLDAEKINSGVFHPDRIPTINASKILGGILDKSVLPAIAITSRIVNTTLANFLTIYNDTTGNMEGDVLILTTDKKTYIHNGGTAGDATDWTLMETPTDLVQSVAGKTGVITLTKNDVGLNNVPNVDATNPSNIVQTSTHRFVTDSEKAIWNGKVANLSDLGITASASELNKLDNVTVGATEFNFLSGLVENVQNRLNNLGTSKQSKILFSLGDPLGAEGDYAFVY
jgi:hypothetical protein